MASLTALLSATSGMDADFVELLARLAQQHSIALQRSSASLGAQVKALRAELKKTKLAGSFNLAEVECRRASDDTPNLSPASPHDPQGSLVTACPTDLSEQRVLMSTLREDPSEDSEKVLAAPTTRSRLATEKSDKFGAVRTNRRRVVTYDSNTSAAEKTTHSCVVSDFDRLIYMEDEDEREEAATRLMTQTQTYRGKSLKKNDKLAVIRDSVHDLKEVTKNKSFCGKLRSACEWYRHLPVVGPYGRFVHYWRLITFVAVMLAVVMGPFDIAFYFWTGPTAYKALGKAIDIIFLLDMVMHFNMADFDHHGTIVTDRIDIAKHYAHSWLLLDIIANVPVDWFVGSDGKSRKFVKFLKLPKILRFIKLLRALKESMHYVGMISCLAMLILLAHVFTCFWVIVLFDGCDGSGQCPPVGSTYLEGFTISLASLAGKEEVVGRIRSSTLFLLALHEVEPLFAVGDPFSPLENFLSACMTVTGVILCACIIATTAHVLEAQTVTARTRFWMLKQRKREMKRAAIPHELKDKVNETYEHLWEHAKSENNGMLRDPVLSLDLRRSLALHIHGPALRKVPMMQDMPDRCLKCLAQKVEVRTYCTGDMLMSFGEAAGELFIIDSGLVQPVKESGEPLRDCFLGAGCVIGEISFLQPDLQRSCSVRCVEFCTALVLTVDAFVELRMTDQLEKLRAQAVMFEGNAEVSKSASYELTLKQKSMPRASDAMSVTTDASDVLLEVPVSEVEALVSEKTKNRKRKKKVGIVESLDIDVTKRVTAESCTANRGSSFLEKSISEADHSAAKSDVSLALHAAANRLDDSGAKEFKGDGEVQHEMRSNLLSQATELNGDGEVQQVVLTRSIEVSNGTCGLELDPNG